MLRGGIRAQAARGMKTISYVQLVCAYVLNKSEEDQKI